MKNKKWLRSVAFLLILAISVIGVSHCYGLPKTYDTKNIAAFDAEKENLVDGVVLGTSVVAHAWLTPVAWKDYGLSIYHLSTSVQPFGIIPDYLDYVDKSQDIKYVIVDIHGLRKESINSGLRPAKFRAAYLNIPDLISRYKILGSLYEYVSDVYEFYGKPETKTEIVDLKDASYIFPLLNFHSRWVDGLVKADYVTVRNEYMGGDDRKTSFDITDCSKYISQWNFGEVQDIDDFQKAQLQTVFDYAEENDLELLFINLPSFRGKAPQQEMRDILEYCKNQGYHTIDFSTAEMVEELGLDLSTDFVNKGHLNSFGGVKVTRYICQYLIDNGFYSKDHRGDESYSHWDETVKEYTDFYKKGLAKAEKQKKETEK